LRHSDYPVNDRSYRPDIDSLRAIAILSVVLYHAGVPWVRGGFTGVDIFFVISGYLIGGHIHRDLVRQKFSFLEFYRLRAKRILPAFFALLAFSMILALILLSPWELSDFSKNALAATLSASNIRFVRSNHYFAPHSELSPLLHTWSLGVEEQYYAVIPVLMVLIARLRLNLLLPAISAICVLSFLFSWHELAVNPAFAFYMLPARAWELGLGMIPAIMEQSGKKKLFTSSLAEGASILGLIMILAPFFLLSVNIPFPGPSALPSVIGTALMISCSTSWLNRRLFHFPPLLFIGKISYSWYLWHWPLLSFMRIVTGGPLSVTVTIIVIALSLLAAICSYYWIEQPFRTTTMAPKPLLLRYAVASCSALLVCVIMWRSQGLPQRYPELAQMEHSVSLLWVSDPCTSLLSSDQLNFDHQCYNSPPDRPVVALWGDSHAMALAPELRLLSQKAGYGYVQMTGVGCPPLIGATHNINDLPLYAATCMRFNNRALAALKNDQHIRLVILAARWNYISRLALMAGDSPERLELVNPSDWRSVLEQSLGASIRSLVDSGKQVIVLEDVPEFDSDPLQAVRTDNIPVRKAIAQWAGGARPNSSFSAPPSSAASAEDTDEVLEKATKPYPGVALVNLRHLLCDSSAECRFRTDNFMIYSDPDHLTPYGSHVALAEFHLPPLTATN